MESKRIMGELIFFFQSASSILG